MARECPGCAEIKKIKIAFNRSVWIGIGRVVLIYCFAVLIQTAWLDTPLPQALDIRRQVPILQFSIALVAVPSLIVGVAEVVYQRTTVCKTCLHRSRDIP